jgi:hypothetical protein
MVTHAIHVYTLIIIVGNLEVIFNIVYNDVSG